MNARDHEAAQARSRSIVLALPPSGFCVRTLVNTFEQLAGAGLPIRFATPTGQRPRAPRRQITPSRHRFGNALPPTLQARYHRLWAQPAFQQPLVLAALEPTGVAALCLCALDARAAAQLGADPALLLLLTRLFAADRPVVALGPNAQRLVRTALRRAGLETAAPRWPERFATWIHAALATRTTTHALLVRGTHPYRLPLTQALHTLVRFPADGGLCETEKQTRTAPEKETAHAPRPGSPRPSRPPEP